MSTLLYICPTCGYKSTRTFNIICHFDITSCPPVSLQECQDIVLTSVDAPTTLQSCIAFPPDIGASHYFPLPDLSSTALISTGPKYVNPGHLFSNVDRPDNFPPFDNEMEEEVGQSHLLLQLFINHNLALQEEMDDSSAKELYFNPGPPLDANKSADNFPSHLFLQSNSDLMDDDGGEQDNLHPPDLTQIYLEGEAEDKFNNLNTMMFSTWVPPDPVICNKFQILIYTLLRSCLHQ